MELEELIVKIRIWQRAIDLHNQRPAHTFGTWNAVQLAAAAVTGSPVGGEKLFEHFKLLLDEVDRLRAKDSQEENSHGDRELFSEEEEG